MTATTEIDYLALCDRLCPYRPSLGPDIVFPNFDPSQRSFEDGHMLIQYNKDIPMRDGIRLRADIFRPLRADNVLPIILAITPYGKQSPFEIAGLPPSRDFDAGFDGVRMSKYTVFEGSDPHFWTERGFAYVAIDARGSYASEGDKANFVSKADGIDGFDAIEYLATLPWSNGHIGMIGASALGAIQWHVAALRPPHLSGILVQDGYTDLYRELAFKGGVYHPNFMAILDDMYRPHGNRRGTPVVHLAEACRLHPFYDEFWELYTADCARIACPMYIVCSLADNGLHTPGTIRGWLAAKSRLKYLELHPYKKWEWQLTDESLERQSAFFNRVLQGPAASEAASTHFWPHVRLHVTHKAYAGSWRSELTYPLPNAVRTRLHLDSSGELKKELPPALEQPQLAKYNALDGSLVWKMQFKQASEITGSSRLHLRFAVDGKASDADLFVTLQKLDTQGNIVHFPYHTFIDEGHVAWGWLRTSQRALDPSPLGDEVAYTHREEDAKPLVSGEFVDLDINIQQTATMFRRGESLQLVLQGHDFGVFGPRCQVPRAGTGVNKDVQNIIALDQSYLEVPMIQQRV